MPVRIRHPTFAELSLAPALGLKAGGMGSDNRISPSVGDSWKIRSNLTLTLTCVVRYVRDLGRTDGDLGHRVQRIKDLFETGRAQSFASIC